MPECLRLLLSIATPLVAAVPTVLMGPHAFVDRPQRWLQALSAHPGAISAAPSYAYAYCAARVPDSAKRDLNLDQVAALIDVKPVRAGSLDRFRSAFASCGLTRYAQRPGYGLSEATALVSAAAAWSGPVRCAFDRAALDRGTAVRAENGCADTVELVSSGRPIDQTVVIVDPRTRRLMTPDAVGEIWISGPNVAQGYWGRAEETARAFHDVLDGDSTGQRSWLRTGDLGVQHDDELYVLGPL
ncbi:MAG: AMP-binding protein [Haloechinothrix sp.]